MSSGMARRRSTKRRIEHAVRSPGLVKEESEPCPHCASGPETYGYLRRAYVYDVDAARQITSDGREPVELESDDVAYLVDSNRIHEQHIDHVDPTFPGIIAHLWGPGEHNAWEHGHLLIDGNHRAARCLRDGLPFRAYVLSELESEQILKRGPGRDGVQELKSQTAAACAE